MPGEDRLALWLESHLSSAGILADRVGARGVAHEHLRSEATGLIPVSFPQKQTGLAFPWALRYCRATLVCQRPARGKGCAQQTPCQIPISLNPE